jgi:hypothetical protein
MQPVLIALRLKDTKVDYTNLFETIKDFGGVTINNWTYILKTKQSPKNVYQTLRPHLQNEDTLMVFSLKRQWQGRGPNELIDWIMNYL